MDMLTRQLTGGFGPTAFNPFTASLDPMSAALSRLAGPAAPTAPAAPMAGGMADPMVLQQLIQMLSSLMMGQSVDPSALAAMGGGDMGGMSGLGGFSGGGGGGGGASSGASGYTGGASGYTGSSNGSSAAGSSPYPTGVTDSGPVAKGTDNMLKDASSMLGMTETGNTSQIMAITGKSGINPATTPWCSAFAINMMKDHGVLDTEGLTNPNYVPTVSDWAASKGIRGTPGQYTPKPGDAIMFDWNGDGTEDHIGLVQSVKDGQVHTIEGNSSDSVKANTYSLSDSNIAGYVKSSDPKGTETKKKAEAPKPPTPAKTPKPAPAEPSKK